MLQYPFWGSKWQKRGFYTIFVVGGTKFRIIKFGYLTFFEAKMTKIVPNDYQQFCVVLSLFQI